MEAFFKCSQIASILDSGYNGGHLVSRQADLILISLLWRMNVNGGLVGSICQTSASTDAWEW